MDWISAMATTASALKNATGAVHHNILPDLATIVAASAESIDKFAREHVAPAIAGAGDMFRQAAHGTEEFGRDKVIPALQNVTLNVDWNNLPLEIKDWIKAHPGQTAFYVVGGVVTFTPGLVSGPLLYSLGWTSTGVRAGTAASAIQRMIGEVAARSIFATVQSGAMGGYGTAAVSAVTRVGGMMFGSLGALFRDKKANETCSGAEEHTNTTAQPRENGQSERENSGE